MEIFLARQPIFEISEKVYAYELLYRSGFRQGPAGVDGSSASARVIVDSIFSLGVDTLTGGKKAFINFTRELLLGDYIQLLPADQVVVEILEDVLPDAQTLAACRQLKTRGYTLALDDFAYSPEMEPLLELVDIVKVDFRSTSLQECGELVERLGPPGIKLIAEKIETREEWKQAVQMGYGYFQGYFFSKPLFISQKTVPGFKLTYIQLLQELSQPDFDFAQAERHFRQDLSLSYKLLRLVNSAAMGLSDEVESIRHALVLLGQENVRKWFSLLVLAEMASSRPQELMVTSVVRAQFWESLGKLAGLAGQENKLFLAGMFSMIDAVLERPLEDALAALPLAEEVKKALLGEDNPLQPVLTLGRCYERGDWDQTIQICRQLEVEDEKVAEAYQEALLWAHGIFLKVPAKPSRPRLVARAANS